MRVPQCFAAAAIALAAGGALAAPLTIDEAVALATRDAPTLEALDARVAATRQAAISAGELPDPKFAFGVENFPVSGPERWTLTGESMTMQRLAWMQELPHRDKREARVAMARTRVVRAEAERRVQALTARREAALAWTRRYTSERQLELIGPLQEENRLLQVAVDAAFAGGRASAAEMLQPRLEAAMIAERRDEWLAQREAAIAALRRWIGDAAAQPLAGKPHRDMPDHGALAQRLHGHPELAAFDSGAALLDAELREARAAQEPDWAVEVAYQRRGRSYGDMVSVQLSIALPLFAATRTEPQIAAKLAERRSLDAEREAAVREHQQALASDVADLTRVDRALLRLRETVLPLWDERVELAMAGYRAGKSTLAEIIAMRRERLETRIKVTTLQGERDTLLTRLHFAYDEPTPRGGAR